MSFRTVFEEFICVSYRSKSYTRITNITHVSLLSVLLLLIGGCSGTIKKQGDSENASQSSNQKKVINIVGHWLKEGRREKLVRELANEFEFLNQEYKVNLVFPDELYWDRSKKNCEYEFNANEMTSPQSKWDIIRINNGYSEQADYMKDPLWAKKYLVDMTEYPEFVKTTLPELVNDSSKRHWKGIIPGPFLEGYNWTIWYNQSFAKELGLNIKQIGMTFDDLLSYVKTIDDYNKTHNTNIVPIQECADWSTINVLTLRLFLSEMGNLNECLQDNFSEKKMAALAKTLKAFEELSKYHAYSPDYKSTIWNKSQNYPLTRKSLFYVNASWMFNIWQGIDPKEVNNMVPAELPVFKPVNVYFGGYFCTWAIPKNAPHKDDAVKFLLFLNRPDVAEKWSRYTKCATGIIGNMTSVKFGADHFEDFTYTIQEKYGLRKIPWVDDASLVMGSSRTNTNLHALDVATGKLTADQAMAEIRKSIRR